MNTRFVEAAQGPKGLNYGKFMLGRLDPAERAARSALPGYEDESLMRLGGLRRLHREFTLVFDLQTGEGASFLLDGNARAARYDLNAHAIWVCPLFEPFLVWLYEQGTWARGQGNLLDVPRYVELPDAPPAMQGYRREGPAEDERVPDGTYGGARKLSQ